MSLMKMPLDEILMTLRVVAIRVRTCSETYNAEKYLYKKNLVAHR